MKDCCKDLSNRGPTEPHGNGSFQRCTVCNRRHFEDVMEPGGYGVAGFSLDKPVKPTGRCAFVSARKVVLTASGAPEHFAEGIQAGPFTVVVRGNSLQFWIAEKQHLLFEERCEPIPPNIRVCTVRKELNSRQDQSDQVVTWE